MDELVHEGKDDVVVSQTQALILGFGGTMAWVAGSGIAFFFLFAAPLSWPMAGVCGFISLSIGLVSLRRSQSVERVREAGAKGAAAILIATGVMNLAMGLLLMVVGLAGIAMLGFSALIWIIVAIVG